jgi:hypothetical protein
LEESVGRRYMEVHGVPLCSDLIRLLAIEKYSSENKAAVSCFEFLLFQFLFSCHVCLQSSCCLNRLKSLNIIKNQAIYQLSIVRHGSWTATLCG